MSLYETEEVAKLKHMIKADLFDRVSMNLSRLIAGVDTAYNMTTSLLTKEELIPLLAKVYVYFLHPVCQNRYQNDAYDFFDLRLRRTKDLNPLKNVYKYGVEIISTFLAYIEDLELFFRNMVDFYMDYLVEIKSLKRIDFNEKVIFKSIIMDFLPPDQRYLTI